MLMFNVYLKSDKTIKLYLFQILLILSVSHACSFDRHSKLNNSCTCTNNLFDN